MSEFKAIRVSPQAKGMIKNLSKKRGKTETDLANHMIAYIYETGLDVYNTSLPSVPDLIKGLDNRIVSFLKKREQDFFVPMQKSFREMIRVHNQTLQLLDVLHPGEIGLDRPENNEVKRPENPGLRIPENEAFKTPEIVLPNKSELEEEKGGENTPEMGSISEVEKEQYLIKIERAEKQKEIFEKELKYLLKNIVPNKSISGPKFTCDLPQKEIDRIKHLVDGH